MPFSPTPGQGSSSPHSLGSFHSPNHTNGCPAAPRAPRSAAGDLPLCAYHQARLGTENPAAEYLLCLPQSPRRVTLNLFGELWFVYITHVPVTTDFSLYQQGVYLPPLFKCHFVYSRWPSFSEHTVSALIGPLCGYLTCVMSFRVLFFI